MRAARGIRTLVLVAVAVAFTPATASAHGALKSSAPAAGAQLAVAPRAIRLNFTEAPELSITTVRLVGPDSGAVAVGPLRIAPDSRRSVIADIMGPLAAGTYTVLWQTAGADGHPVRDRFTFVILPGAQGLTAAPATPALPGEAGAGVTAPGQSPPPAQHHDPVTFPAGRAFDAESPVYVAIRWALYAGLLVVLGAVAFHSLVLGGLRRGRAPDSTMLAMAGTRAARAGWVAALVVAGAAVARLVAQSYALHGAERAFDLRLIGTMLQRTVWGWGWLLQAAGVALALAGFRLAARGRKRGWSVAALGAAALAFTPPLSGHAAATPRMLPLAVLADGLHVIGAGGWLGSLLLVIAVGVPAAMRLGVAQRGRAVADLVNAFSPTALVFAGITAATGVFAAWLHLGTVSALWQTSYGKTLLLKLAILSIVAATGAYNWRRVKPALGDDTGVARIRRSGTVEVAVGVLVLVVTAVLVATPTATDRDSAAQVGHAAQVERSAR